MSRALPEWIGKTPDAKVPPRVRLAFSFLLSLAMTPLVANVLPGLPDTVGGMGAWVLREVIIGLLIGAILRSMMAALAVAVTSGADISGCWS